MSRRIELALKKQILLLDCAAQRQRLAECAAGVKPLLAGADKVNEAARWLQRHPVFGAAAGALLVVLRPRSVWRWSVRGWSAWRVVQRLRKRT